MPKATRPLAASQTFDFNVASAILRAEKPNKGLEAKAAANANLMHRLTGYLPDGTKVAVAQRHGKGGMDFNKLLGGKVFAVAADGFSPVFEKGADKKPTKVQKLEDGLPLYSASGFYLLSSKEYPALEITTAYALLQDDGARALLLTDEQLADKVDITLESELDWELLELRLADALSDSNSLVAGFDADINKKRQRGISRAREEAEDTEEPYAGVEFKELAASAKSGSPFVMLVWTTESARGHAFVLREGEVVDQDTGLLHNAYFDPEQAIAYFKGTKAGRALLAELDRGHAVSVGLVQGHDVRTSVSFKRKAENVAAAPKGAPRYGDAVFIEGALKGWCRAIVNVMYSQHPNFPLADYEAHHYVAALRQVEVGMNKRPAGQTGWLPPVAMHYGVGSWLLASLPLPQSKAVA